jgi:putative FmdB family regulatory protein
MPIYDYRCEECGHLMEVIHGVDAPGPASCAVCGGPVRKLMSTPAILFKGSGWAKKDAQTAARSHRASESAGGDGKASDASGADSGAVEAGDGPAKGDGPVKGSDKAAEKPKGTEKATASVADKPGAKRSGGESD